MKCGICGATEYKHYESWRSTREEKPREIYDASDLAIHKRLDHKAEVAAQIAKMRAGKQLKEDRERALREARATAARAVARPTVEHYPFVEEPNHIVVGTTANYLWGKRYAHSRVRYPGAAAWQAYQTMQAQIQSLKEAAQKALVQAYDTGTPVPDADYEEVSKAIAAVPQA